ncbi:hypothetical protein K353_06157 [Kitasatospora sp. SolWspMP-SS2h]|nr:hypothetical protein [Kitasatospora sp. SolWspMP-SS2h]RAJ31253.1 hypothetical protein K353_06157 [Kitasatospora sp. SolWspMP-SS2h]
MPGALLRERLPAARVLAAAHLSGSPHTRVSRTALTQVTAAWRSIGITT